MARVAVDREADATQLLVLAGPLAIVAGALWFRGVKRAPMIAIGPLGYALYMYVQFILVPDYTRYSGNNERWFPMYLLMVMASWIMALEAWREIEQPARFARHRTTRLFGGLLLLLNSLFALAWWSSHSACCGGARGRCAPDTRSAAWSFCSAAPSRRWRWRNCHLESQRSEGEGSCPAATHTSARSFGSLRTTPDVRSSDATQRTGAGGS